MQTPANYFWRNCGTIPASVLQPSIAVLLSTVSCLVLIKYRLRFSSMRSICRGFLPPRGFSGTAKTESCGLGSLTAAIAAAIAGGMNAGTYLLDFLVEVAA